MMGLGSTQTSPDKHLACNWPHFTPRPALSAFPPWAGPTLQAYDPDAEKKTHICDPHAANPCLSPKPKGIVNCLDSRLVKY